MNTQMKQFGDLNIFIDASYVMYYTVHGAFSMWKNEYNSRFNERCPEKVVQDAPDITNDDKYLYCLQKKMENNLDSIFNIIKDKMFDGFHPPGLRPKVYFCLDDVSRNYWRKQSIFKEYKSHRKSVPSFFNAGKAFRYLYEIILPQLELEEFFGIKSILVDSAEADDIIMTLVRRMKHNNNCIIATDHDMIQVLDKARMFDLQGKEINISYISNKCIGSEDMTSETYLKTKLLVGDKSDNIPQVFERVGWKKAWDLMSDKETLKEKLKDQQAFNRLQLNSKLIDCKYIPSDIQKDIIKSYIETKS